MNRVFSNGPGDWGSIPGRVIPKTQKMVLDAALLNIQHYKVRIKGKVEQSREWSSALGSPSTKGANLLIQTFREGLLISCSIGTKPVNVGSAEKAT